MNTFTCTGSGLDPVICSLSKEASEKKESKTKVEKQACQLGYIAWHSSIAAYFSIMVGLTSEPAGG